MSLSSVASARLRGRGYFFLGLVGRVIVWIVRLVFFPERVAEQQPFAHDRDTRLARSWA